MQEEPTTSGLLKTSLSSRAARFILAGVLFVGCAAVLLSAVIVRYASTGDCSVTPNRRLSMRELISVKKRFEAYKRDPSAGLQLTSDELSMLIEDTAEAPVYVDLQDSHLHTKIALPASDGTCWPITFDGDFQVKDGRTFVVPEHLTVGLLDLSRLTRGMRVELTPSNMPNARIAHFLKQTRHASVVNSTLKVELHTPANFQLEPDPPAAQAVP